MQCGPPFTTSRRAPLMSLAVRSPAAVIGTMRSSAPWMTSVGTSMRARSSRKSSCQVGTVLLQKILDYTRCWRVGQPPPLQIAPEKLFATEPFYRSLAGRRRRHLKPLRVSRLGSGGHDYVAGDRRRGWHLYLAVRRGDRA